MAPRGPLPPHLIPAHDTRRFSNTFQPETYLLGNAKYSNAIDMRKGPGQICALHTSLGGGHFAIRTAHGFYTCTGLRYWGSQKRGRQGPRAHSAPALHKRLSYVPLRPLPINHPYPVLRRAFESTCFPRIRV